MSVQFVLIKNSLCLYLSYSLVGWGNKVDGIERLLKWV